MMWSTFITYLSVSYLTYYMLNLIYDWHRSKSRTSNEPHTAELYYHETSSPLPVHFEEQESLDQGDIADTMMPDTSQSPSAEEGMDLRAIAATAKNELQKLIKNI